MRKSIIKSFRKPYKTQKGYKEIKTPKRKVWGKIIIKIIKELTL